MIKRIGLAVFAAVLIITAILNADEIDMLRKSSAALNEGRAHADSADYEKAINSFTKANLLRPDWHEPFYHRGRAYFKLNDYEKALEDFNKAIIFKEDYELAYIARGIVFMHEGRFDRALADYHSACELDSTNLQSRYNRGIAAFLNKHFDLALEDFNYVEQNADTLENYYQIYKYRGRIDYSKGEFKESIEQLSKFINKFPDDAESYLWRSEAYQAITEFEKALEDSDKYLELSGTD